MVGCWFVFFQGEGFEFFFFLSSFLNKQPTFQIVPITAMTNNQGDLGFYYGVEQLLQQGITYVMCELSVPLCISSRQPGKILLDWQRNSLIKKTQTNPTQPSNSKASS